MARCPVAWLVLGGLPLVLYGESASRTRPLGSQCVGAYANDLGVLSPASRQLEGKTRYTFCLRSAVVYDCPYFGPSGTIRHRRETSTSHGTAFAFRPSNAQTYFLTNEHLTDWPFVTTAEIKVPNISTGCKRVSQTLHIVEKEEDDYPQDDVPMQRVLADTELDVSILKAAVKVPVVPFDLGQSSALEVGNVVQVRGFPLGAFQAVSVGKVLNPSEHDTEEQWDHHDFVTDAQLSSGNSGSPVLAVSCKTRRLELVGIFHAAYREGQSLNVAVGIDELRELMTTLKPRKKHQAPEPVLTAADRRQLNEELRRPAFTPVVPFGGHAIGIRAVGERLLYEVYSKGYPLADWRLMVLEDLPGAGFGRLGRIWFGNEAGLAEVTFSSLKPEEQHRAVTMLDELRLHVFDVMRYRKREPEAKRSRGAHDQIQALRRRLDRNDPGHRQTMRIVAELAGRYAPAVSQTGLPLSVITSPPAASVPAAQRGTRPPAAPSKDK